MGGGRKFMLPKNMSDVEYPGEKKHNGTRKDGRNLIQEWIDRMKDNVRATFKKIICFFFSIKTRFCFWISSTIADALQDIFILCTSHGSLTVWYVIWRALVLSSCLVCIITWTAHVPEELQLSFSHKSPISWMFILHVTLKEITFFVCFTEGLLCLEQKGSSFTKSLFCWISTGWVFHLHALSKVFNNV